MADNKNRKKRRVNRVKKARLIMKPRQENERSFQMRRRFTVGGSRFSRRSLGYIELIPKELPSQPQKKGTSEIEGGGVVPPGFRKTGVISCRHHFYTITGDARKIEITYENGLKEIYHLHKGVGRGHVQKVVGEAFRVDTSFDAKE